MNGMGLATALRELIDAPEPVRDYTGFPDWYALLVEPNREEMSAKRLGRVHAHPYLPQFRKQHRLRGERHCDRLAAVIPGMLFVPVEMIAPLWGDDLMDFAHLRGCLIRGDGAPARLPKTDIEKIREIEATLNLPPAERPPELQQLADEMGLEPPPPPPIAVGTEVRIHRFDKTGIVVEVAKRNVFGVEVANLFGRTVKIYLPASEIEAL